MVIRFNGSIATASIMLLLIEISIRFNITSGLLMTLFHEM